MATSEWKRVLGQFERQEGHLLLRVYCPCDNRGRFPWNVVQIDDNRLMAHGRTLGATEAMKSCDRASKRLMPKTLTA